MPASSAVLGRSRSEGGVPLGPSPKSHLGQLTAALTGLLPQPKPRLAILIHDLLACGLRSPPRLRSESCSCRSARRLLRRRGLPTPQAFMGLARCTWTLSWARESYSPIAQAAIETGWSDASSFSRRCLQLFGQRPGYLRQLEMSDLVTLWLSSARGSLPAERLEPREPKL